MIQLYGWSNLIGALLNLTVALFVYIKGHRAKLSKIWSIFAFSAVFYGFGAWLAVTAKDPKAAFFWWQVSHGGVILLPVLFTHFVFSFLNIKKPAFIRIMYVASFTILLIDILSKRLFIGHVKLLFENSKWFAQAWWVYPPGPVFVFFVIVFYIGFLTFDFILLLFARNKVNPLKRNQINYFSIAAILGFIGGGTSYLPCFGINLYPIFNIAVPLHTFIIAYAIVRHQLMDIEVVIKKTLVFASLFTIIFGIFVAVALLIQQFIGAGNNLLGFAISSIVIILAVRPLEDFLTKVTDKYLFQKKYDYKQILKSFIDEVITVLSLDTIVKSTLDLLDKTLHPETATILLLNKFEDKYNSYQNLGLNRDISWDNKSVIPAFLKTTKDILSIEKSENSVKSPDKLNEEMRKYDAKLAIPLMLHNDMIGIMLLGKKRSDEEYTQDDLEILTDLARTESVAIGNAQLFSETAQNERRAAIGTLAAGINHEIGNPLNIINTKMQVYLMSLERGLYNDKKPEDIISEAGEIMKTCLQQTTRISDITRKLSSFAKPSKDFKPELTDIEEQLDDTLDVVGHDLELERIEIKKRIQKPLSKILSDKRQIQQIFFNIIRNAGQAIKEKGVIEISAVDTPDGNVKIEISDTGQDIPEDKMDKIYEPFFTTKEPGKGTGLGLSIVRQLVWRNKGDIKVRSKIGEGTTFTITFPAAK